MAVIGPGSAVQGRRSGLLPAPVEAVVLSGCRLDHYRRQADRPDRPWVRVGTVTEGALGPGALAVSGRVLLAAVAESGGTAVYRRTDTGWEPEPHLAEVARPGGVVPSAADLGVDPERLRAVAPFTVDGRRRVLADEAGSVFEYQFVAGAWERCACLRLDDTEPFAAPARESVKLAQVTGSRDATPTPWGERLPTLSDSLASAGIRGTDLGVRVDHAGRSFLLFGDTHWTRRWLSTRDSIAEVVPTGPVAGLPGVRFHGSPLKLVGGGTTMREYDVPLDGFSLDGQLYAFFTSNHFRAGRVMGRSVLAVAGSELRLDPSARRRPIRFRVLGTFSDRHFRNVSVQLAPAAALPGCPGQGQVLLVWGSGAYRASEPRLALLDQAALARLVGGAPPEEFGTRYWTGQERGEPVWSPVEAEARPLLWPAALGELSVRWVPAAGCYLMLAASGPEDPIGHAITLRAARQPWGPWSHRLRLLDWVGTGMAVDPHTRFIKAHEADEVGDRMFGSQARGTGAAYAPYLFDAVREGQELVLRYTLSTWNPYQVVLMQHRLPLADLPAPPPSPSSPRKL